MSTRVKSAKRKKKYLVRIRHVRGACKTWVVASTASHIKAALWAENLKAALRESLTNDSLTVRIALAKPKGRK